MSHPNPQHDPENVYPEDRESDFILDQEELINLKQLEVDEIISDKIDY